MIFTNSTVFIVILIIILVIIYIGQNNLDNFDQNLLQSYQPVNYNSLEQNCNQLTSSPSKCTVDSIIPSNANVCDDKLSPVTNNQKHCKKIKKDLKKKPSLSLKYDFDLLSSLNNSQINNTSNKNINNQNINNQNTNNNIDLMTDIRSLDSLENDLISNY